MSFITGLLAGLFGGLLGIGGGAIMIPLMVGFMNVKQHQAHGTSLAAMIFLGTTGAITYTMRGSVDLVASVLLATTAIGMAHVGVRFAHALPEWKLKRYFGVFLLFVSVSLFLKSYIANPVFLAVGWTKVLILLIVGIFTGFLSGMMGVGGGAVMIPAMVIFIGLDQHTAQGSSLLTMVPTGIAGAWTHFRLGNIQTHLLAGLIAGVFIGTYMGGNIAHMLREGTLRTIFGSMLIWTGTRYIISSRA